MDHFLLCCCYMRVQTHRAYGVCTFLYVSRPSIDAQEYGPGKVTAGLQENPETLGFVLRVVRSCPGSGGSETGQGPDLSSAFWASKVNSGGPPFLSFPCTPAPQGPALAAGERKVPTGFFFLPLKGLQVFVPETHD